MRVIVIESCAEKLVELQTVQIRIGGKFVLEREEVCKAHKGGVRIGKTPKKLASICCP
jgi:hypothetical protein